MRASSVIRGASWLAACLVVAGLGTVRGQHAPAVAVSPDAAGLTQEQYEGIVQAATHVAWRLTGLDPRTRQRVVDQYVRSELAAVLGLPGADVRKLDRAQSDLAEQIVASILGEDPGPPPAPRPPSPAPPTPVPTPQPPPAPKPQPPVPVVPIVFRPRPVVYYYVVYPRPVYYIVVQPTTYVVPVVNTPIAW